MTISIKPTASGSTIEQDGSTILTVDGSGNITTAYNLSVSGTVSSTGDVAFDTDTLYVDTTNHNVGIGTTTPTNFGSNFKMLAVEGSGYGVIQSRSTSGSVITEIMASPTLGFIGTRNNHPLVLRVNDTERMRIYTNGNVGVTNNLDFVGGAATVRIHLGGGTPTSSNTGIAAAWNVHSDYRLKENVSSINDATNIVKNLNPVNFSWIEDNSDIATTQGFIAHELQENAPFAVLGNKDAVNENGDNVYQAADYSKLVPLLTAALQEAITKIEALEARVATLEGN